MTFAEFFRKDNRNIIEMLEEDAQEDIKLLKKIHEMHSQKLTKVKELVDAWEHGRNFEGFDSFVREVKSTNKELIKLIDKMLELETKEESIVKLLLARNAEELGLKIQYDIRHLVENLKDSLRRLHDILMNLRFLIAKQNDYIERNWSGEIVLDYEKHGTFFLMLKDETTIEERLDKFAVWIENEARYLLGLVKTKPEGEISFEEVFSPHSPDFIKLYNETFVEIFPDPGELLSLTELNDNLRWRYERIRKKGELYHIIIIKVGHTPVGASMFSTNRVNKIVCLGALWYFFLTKKMAEEDLKRKGVLAKQLFEVTKQILERDMQRLGYKQLSAMVADLPPNPERKTEWFIRSQEFKKIVRGKTKKEIGEIINGYKYSFELLLRLVRIIGFRIADFQYVVSSLTESKNPKMDVKYLDFKVCPLRGKWKETRRIHSSEILPILKFYVDSGLDLLNERPELYEKMERDIVKKGFVRLI